MTLALLPYPRFRATDDDGNPLAGGLLYAYAATTSTPQALLTSDGSTSAANPVVLDAQGEADIRLGPNAYKLVLKTSAGVELWTVDSISSLAPTTLGDYSATVAQMRLQTDPGEVGSESLATSLAGEEERLRYAIYDTKLALDPGIAYWYETPVRLPFANVLAYGAVGDGSTDDTAAIASAVAAGTVILFPPGKTYKVSGIDCSGKALVLLGYGATVTCTGGTGAFSKTDHDNKLQVYGFSFTGSGSGVNHTVATSTSVYDELEVCDCSFNMNAGAYGIYSIGSREARFCRNTFFSSHAGNGMYFAGSVSPFVDQCIFRGVGNQGTAVNYAGTGLGYDAGLVLQHCEVLGWSNGVLVTGTDWLKVDGCTIDYNTVNFKVSAQDGGIICNNYLGSLNTNPALWITYDGSPADPKFCDKLIITGNTFTGHDTSGNLYDCLLVDGTAAPDSLQISHNSLHFYTRYGINFTLATATRVLITDNTFGQRTGFGVSPIYNASGANDSGVRIARNYFANTATIAGMNLGAFSQVSENFGCVTENQGEAIVGAGLSTYDQAHGLAYTPSKSHVQLTPTNSAAATAQPYISAVGATNITIGFVTATGATSGVAWHAKRMA